MKIKVGFDLSPAIYYGGVGTYTKELAMQLANNEGLEMKFWYMTLRGKYDLNLNARRIPLPAVIYEPLLNDWRLLSVENIVGKIDIYHSSDWVQARTTACKVTTVHDVIPFKFPEWSKKDIINVHKKRLKLIEKEVDSVICVSETTKNDLLEVSNIDPKKVRVVYEGVSDRFKILPANEVASFRRSKGLPDDFVLAVGGVGTRRNLDRIKKACELLKMKLIVTGEDVVVSDSEMVLLYNCATALIYVSLYEGFGLPIIEAFKCGIPVVTSNIGAMKEIAGSAAVLVDPISVDEIMDGIRSVSNKAKRAELVRNGQDRAAQFSWQKCAAATYEIYKGLLS